MVTAVHVGRELKALGKLSRRKRELAALDITRHNTPKPSGRKLRPKKKKEVTPHCTRVAGNQWIIYQLVCKSTGMKYTGKTKQELNMRLKAHRNQQGPTGCRLLRAAIQKYGWRDFTVNECHKGQMTSDEADELEGKYILKTIYPRGLNLRHGAKTGALQSKKRVPWDDSEVDALLQGIKKHGKGAWAKILRDDAFRFATKRTAVDLKDKFRNLKS